MNDMTPQRSALAAARRERAELLVDIAKGLLTPREFIDMARDPWWIALRRASLKQVIISEPDVGAGRWRQVRDRMLDALDIKVPDKYLTVGWVLDPRAGGRRYLALVDALRPREAPWPGFPWEPNPSAVDDGGPGAAGTGTPTAIG